jgi:hypothetical protein
MGKLCTNRNRSYKHNEQITDDLFDGNFQQKILVVDKMIFKTKIKLEN